jgi:hypothetical protein
MTFFTDSPFERMMVQKPRYRREERPPAPPKCRSEQSHEYCRDLIITQKINKPER